MKTLTGTIVSAKTPKTVTVLVERLWQHPIYKKMIKKSKKYSVHTQEKLKEGMLVKIADAGKKFSKTKSWQVIEILKK